MLGITQSDCKSIGPSQVLTVTNNHLLQSKKLKQKMIDMQHDLRWNL